VKTACPSRFQVQLHNLQRRQDLPPFLARALNRARSRVCEIARRGAGLLRAKTVARSPTRCTRVRLASIMFLTRGGSGPGCDALSAHAACFFRWRLASAAVTALVPQHCFQHLAVTHCTSPCCAYSCWNSKVQARTVCQARCNPCRTCNCVCAHMLLGCSTLEQSGRGTLPAVDAGAGYLALKGSGQEHSAPTFTVLSSLTRVDSSSQPGLCTPSLPRCPPIAFTMASTPPTTPVFFVDGEYLQPPTTLPLHALAPAVIAHRLQDGLPRCLHGGRGSTAPKCRASGKGRPRPSWALLIHTCIFFAFFFPKKNADALRASAPFFA
jgi:hypothetical protein